MPIQTFVNHVGATLYAGDHPTRIAALEHCAANGVPLDDVVLAGETLDGARVSGLHAPRADLRGSSCLGWIADRAVGGRVLELSAAQLGGCPFDGAALTHANLLCTRPTSFRVETGANTNLRGCDWSACPDVIVLPVRDDQVGKVIALRNGTGWKVHAGERGVLTEAQAKVTLAARPEYTAALAWLDSAEGVAAKAAIDARPAGTGPVVRPTPPAGGKSGVTDVR